MEELNTSGVEVVPRPAATVIVLRGGAETLELLLVQRTPQARFMGGVWVFPGGAVDPGEDERQAARRELHEEAAVELDPGQELLAFSRWITPTDVTIRFDTWFFVTSLPPGAQPRIDGEECIALDWFTPAGALEAHAREEITLVFPTIKHLEQLSMFPTADAVLDHARSRDVRPIQPRLILTGEVARIVLPGDPDY